MSKKRKLQFEVKVTDLKGRVIVMLPEDITIDEFPLIIVGPTLVRNKK